MTTLPKVTNTYIQQEAPSELLCAIENQIIRLRDLYDGPNSRYLSPESREMGLRRIASLTALADQDNLHKWIPGFAKSIIAAFPDAEPSETTDPTEPSTGETK